SLLDIQKEAFSIKGSRSPFTSRGNGFNSEGAVRMIPMGLTITELGSGRGEWEQILLTGTTCWGMKPSWHVNDSVLSSCSVIYVFHSSEKKYCSGTGWPSFSEAHGTPGSDENHTGILRRLDTSLGSARTEVVCKQ
ncbi:hypothetical protein P7K49_039415, partial [Saguinus oedipus]